MGNCTSEAGEAAFTKEPALKFLQSKITQKYRIVEELKSALYPKMAYKVADISTGEERVLRKWRLTQNPSNLGEVHEFMNVHAAVDHPQILAIMECYKTEKEAQFIFAVPPGKPILKWFRGQQELDDEILGKIVVQLLVVLNFVHQQRVCLRALDPDNVYFDGKTVYLQDLSLAKFRRVKPFEGPIGKPYLVSPEMALGVYSRANDVWQAGVIFHLIATGHPVVEGNTYVDVAHKFRRRDFDIDKFKVMIIDRELKDVVVDTLEPDAKARKKLSVLVKMPFFEQFQKRTSAIFTRKSIFKNKLDAFVFKNSFHKAVHKFLVKQASTEEERVLALREFKKIDLDGNGMLDAAEIEKALEGMNETDVVAKVEGIFRKLGVPLDRQISYHEFLEIWVDFDSFYSKDRLQKHFRGLDLNGNGYITEDELVATFGEAVRTAEYSSVIDRYAKNKRIDFEGFVKLIAEIAKKS